MKRFGAQTCKISKTTKISKKLAAELCGVTERTIYYWLEKRLLVDLTPADIRHVIEWRALKKYRQRPRGKPFKRGYDPRRSD